VTVVTSRATGLFLILTGGALVPVGAVLYAVPSGPSTAGLYLFILGLALLGTGVAASARALLLARWSRLASVAEAALYSALVAVALAAAYRIVAGRPLRADCTQDRLFTLTAQTRRVLARLAAPVRLWAFFDRNDPRLGHLRGLLAEYEQASRLVTAQVLDPQERPSEANRLGAAGMSGIVLESGARRVRVRTPDEPHISGGLARLAAPPLAVGFVTGHGERDLAALSGRAQLSGLVELLELENVDPVRLSLASGEAPEDLRALVIAGPRTDLTPGEAERVERFLGRGRGVLVALELAADPQPNLAALLARRGIEIPHGIVIDLDHHAKNDAGTLILDELPVHAVTRGLSGLVLSGTRPLVPRDPQPAGVAVEALAVTGRRSWMERDAPRDHVFTPGRDLSGPLAVAAAASGTAGRVLAVGNSLFMTDLFIGALANRDFLVGGLAWVAEAADMPAIVPDPRMHRMLAITGDALHVIGAVVCLGMPMLSALVGLFVHLSRD
jgi:hypothetical protein